MLTEEKFKNAATSARKYKIVRSEKLGRYLVAAKNLKAGEVILRENPIVVGPTSFNKDLLCFACSRLLPKIKKELQYVCTKCGIAPLCGAICEKESRHHTSDECELFRSNKNLSTDSTTDLIGVLLPMRLYLLKNKDSVLWDKVESMESHMDKRQGTLVWKDREANVVNIVQKLRLMSSNEASSNDFLQQLCGILDVNTFELRSPGGLDDLLLRGLYADASLMAHDCRGNTHLTVDDDFQLTIFASLPIEENAIIFFNYTSSLLGTTERREHLREGKYFECECSMCKDPYEMESHLSSVLCPRCKEGYLGAENPLSINPYERNNNWRCNACMKICSGYIVKSALNIARTLIDDVDDLDLKALDALLKKLTRSFHSNHFLVLALKQKLLAVYRKEVASPNPKKKIIQKMLDLCKEIFIVLEIVEPGISRLKGILLYEMHLPMILLANRAYSGQEIRLIELISRLEEAKDILKQALTMLLLEPIATPEGRLAKRALQELKVLTQNINDAKSLSMQEEKPHSRKTKEKRN